MSRCRNPKCPEEDAILPWLDMGFCSYDCRVRWCLDNDRDVYGVPKRTAKVLEEALERAMDQSAADLTANVPASVIKDGPSFAEVLSAVRDLPAPLEPVEVTQEELAALKAVIPPAEPDPYPMVSDIGPPLHGIPLVVKEDPAPRPGWLEGLLRRLFG